MYALALLTLISPNAYNHFRLRSNGPTPWRLLMALLIADVVLISVAVAFSGGFSHYFLHLLYYPALAGFAVLFTSLRLNIAWVTIALIVYLTLGLTVGAGIDAEAREEKALLARIAVMYAVVAMVNLATGFERTRWRQSVERELEIERERLELSQSIHDTVAQTAYMVGLGVDRARKLADGSDRELVSTLDGTAELMRTVIWELRRPLDGGQVNEGANLGAMLRNHAATFTTVTSVPAAVQVQDAEPVLPSEMHTRLFAIVHNALTNANRHAQAGQVDLELEFGTTSVRMSVTDDGVGVPDGYERRGRGISGMRATPRRTAVASGSRHLSYGAAQP